LWLISALKHIQKDGRDSKTQLVFIAARFQNQVKPAEDSSKKLNDAAEAAKNLTTSITAASEKLQATKSTLDGLLQSIKEERSTIANSQAELEKLRQEKPALDAMVVDLQERVGQLQLSFDSEQASLRECERRLDAEKSDHATTRSRLEGELSERCAELSSAGGEVIRLKREIEGVTAELTLVSARRDELGAEASRLQASVSDLELRLSTSLSAHESFVDWVLSSEVREAFPDEIGGLLASRSGHELLAAIAQLKDAHSELSEEVTVLANIRHLGSLVVLHYKAQGLDAGQRDAKLRKWADFVNSKAAGHAQVIVPGLRFPVNAAVMVAPDGVKVISDVHCWQVNNVKGVVYAPAKVS
jgi:uncharacterized coiled-coil DUF342 family protein